MSDVNPTGPSAPEPVTPEILGERALPLAAPRSPLDVVPVDETRANASMRKVIRAALITVGVFVFGFGTLAATTVIGGAVIGTGVLIVESSSKKVQHPSGGVIGEILVREGDHVKAGQVVIRLDPTVAKARLEAVTEAYDRQLARLERLTAERDNKTELVFSDALLARLKDHPKGEVTLQNEREQFNARLAEREGLRSQLKERLAQSEEIQKGLTEQLAALDNQVASMKKEVERLRELAAKKVVTQSVLAEAERRLLELEGDRAALASQIATEKGRATEIQLQQSQIDQNFQTRVTEEMYDAQRQVAELEQQEAVARDTINRIDIVAPLGGIVHELAVHTVGGVIQPAETLMLIVPEDDGLVGDVKISPADVDQLRAQQPATIHFSAFDRATTPTATGFVKSISADLEEDRRTGALYYSVRIELPPEEVAKLGELKLMPGMPIEAFIQTNDRTILSYLAKPLTDQIARAFRD